MRSHPVYWSQSAALHIEQQYIHAPVACSNSNSGHASCFPTHCYSFTAGMSNPGPVYSNQYCCLSPTAKHSQVSTINAPRFPIVGVGPVCTVFHQNDTFLDKCFPKKRYFFPGAFVSRQLRILGWNFTCLCQHQHKLHALPTNDR